MAGTRWISTSRRRCPNWAPKGKGGELPLHPLVERVSSEGSGRYPPKTVALVRIPEARRARKASCESIWISDFQSYYEVPKRSSPRPRREGRSGAPRGAADHDRTSMPTTTVSAGAGVCEASLLEGTDRIGLGPRPPSAYRGTGSAPGSRDRGCVTVTPTPGRVAMRDIPPRRSGLRGRPASPPSNRAALVGFRTPRGMRSRSRAGRLNSRPRAVPAAVGRDRRAGIEGLGLRRAGSAGPGPARARRAARGWRRSPCQSGSRRAVIPGGRARATGREAMLHVRDTVASYPARPRAGAHRLGVVEGDLLIGRRGGTGISGSRGPGQAPASSSSRPDEPERALRGEILGYGRRRSIGSAGRSRLSSLGGAVCARTLVGADVRRGRPRSSELIVGGHPPSDNLGGPGAPGFRGSRRVARHSGRASGTATSALPVRSSSGEIRDSPPGLALPGHLPWAIRLHRPGARDPRRPEPGRLRRALAELVQSQEGLAERLDSLAAELAFAGDHDPRRHPIR